MRVWGLGLTNIVFRLSSGSVCIQDRDYVGAFYESRKYGQVVGAMRGEVSLCNLCFHPRDSLPMKSVSVI